MKELIRRYGKVNSGRAITYGAVLYAFELADVERLEAAIRRLAIALDNSSCRCVIDECSSKNRICDHDIRDTKECIDKIIDWAMKP